MLNLALSYLEENDVAVVANLLKFDMTASFSFLSIQTQD